MEIDLYTIRIRTLLNFVFRTSKNKDVGKRGEKDTVGFGRSVTIGKMKPYADSFTFITRPSVPINNGTRTHVSEDGKNRALKCNQTFPAFARQRYPSIAT